MIYKTLKICLVDLVFPEGGGAGIQWGRRAELPLSRTVAGRCPPELCGRILSVPFVRKGGAGAEQRRGGGYPVRRSLRLDGRRKFLPKNGGEMWHRSG